MRRVQDDLRRGRHQNGVVRLDQCQFCLLAWILAQRRLRVVICGVSKPEKSALRQRRQRGSRVRVAGRSVLGGATIAVVLSARSGPRPSLRFVVAGAVTPRTQRPSRSTRRRASYPGPEFRRQRPSVGLRARHDRVVVAGLGFGRGAGSAGRGQLRPQPLRRSTPPRASGCGLSPPAGRCYAAPVFFREGDRMLLLAASTDRLVYAIDASNGRQVWVHSVEDYGPPWAALAWLRLAWVEPGHRQRSFRGLLGLGSLPGQQSTEERRAGSGFGRRQATVAPGVGRQRSQCAIFVAHGRSRAAFSRSATAMCTRLTPRRRRAVEEDRARRGSQPAGILHIAIWPASW